MWASLDALVQNGHGNRHTATLNAIGVLYSHCREYGSPEMDAAFDSVIVQIVPDLDHETIVAISPAVENVVAQFPNFSAIIHEHMQRQSVNSDAAANVNEPHSFSHTAVLAGGQSDLAETEKLKRLVLDSDPPVERRQQARDPISDANNPISLARRASQKELLQIAGLPNLPEALTNVLISRGERDVIERTLKNHSAQFAKSSLTTLAELAPSDRMIKECMVARSDLPEPIVERMMPFLGLEAKARVLLSGAPFSQQNCESALEKATQELANNLDQGQVMLGLDHCLASLHEGLSSPSDVVSILAKDARVAELSAFASVSLGISQTAAFNALSSRFDHAAVIILRGLDCNAAAFDDAMNMRRRCGCREARETKSAWNLSQRYTVADAKELARCFDTVIDSMNGPSDLKAASSRLGILDDIAA